MDIDERISCYSRLLYEEYDQTIMLNLIECVKVLRLLNRMDKNISIDKFEIDLEERLKNEYKRYGKVNEQVEKIFKYVIFCSRNLNFIKKQI